MEKSTKTLSVRNIVLNAPEINTPSNCLLLAVRPYSIRDGDNYLAVILAYRQETNELVTWVYNYQSRGCSHGHYHKDADEAFRDFLTRAIPAPSTDTKDFTCPKCKGHRLEEVMSDVTLTSTILNVGPGGDVEYGPKSEEDGEVDHYQCQNCNLVIVNSKTKSIVRHSDQLYEWLQENKSNDDPA